MYIPQFHYSVLISYIGPFSCHALSIVVFFNLSNICIHVGILSRASRVLHECQFPRPLLSKHLPYPREN